MLKVAQQVKSKDLSQASLTEGQSAQTVLSGHRDGARLPSEAPNSSTKDAETLSAAAILGPSTISTRVLAGFRHSAPKSLPALDFCSAEQGKQTHTIHQPCHPPKISYNNRRLQIKESFHTTS